MASLTPLSKSLIALAVLGGMASAVWHLGLKEKLGDLTAGQTPSASSTTVVTPSATAKPAEPAPVLQGSPKSTTPEPANASPKLVETGAPSKLSAAQNAEMGRKLMDLGNFAQARPHLEAAVQGGDGGAACHLGEMTLKGQGGLAANQEQAAKLFQLAQSRGSICFASGQ
jgi:TPR repeat protein